MTIEARIWDKVSPVNGRDAAFLRGHFKKQNGNDDRVLITYDGVVSRIEYVSGDFFTDGEREHVGQLIGGGMDEAAAIAEVWRIRITEEHEAEIAEQLSIQDISAALDILMGGHDDEL